MKRGYSFLLIASLLAFLLVFNVGVKRSFTQTEPEPHRTMIPDLDDTYDIGSAEREWNDAYIDGNLNVDLIKATSADSINYATCTDADDVTYTLTLTDYPTLAAGLRVYFIASTPNTTGTANISYNSTVDSVKMLHNQTPAASYIEDASVVEVIFNGTNWELVSPDNNP